MFEQEALRRCFVSIDRNEALSYEFEYTHTAGFTMLQPEKLLNEMDKILNQLIENGNKLLAASKQVIEEDELMRLQKEQETMLDKLIAHDTSYQKCSLEQNSKGNKLSLLRAKIDEKIEAFQKLNAEFVENISAVHGLIQFDKGHIKKR